MRLVSDLIAFAVLALSIGIVLGVTVDMFMLPDTHPRYAQSWSFY